MDWPFSRARSEAKRLVQLIQSVGDVQPEPGYDDGFLAMGDVLVGGLSRLVEVYVPIQADPRARITVCFPGPPAAPRIELDASSGSLRALNFETKVDLARVEGTQALVAAEQLLAKLADRRRRWASTINRVEADRVVRAFFSPWPQSMNLALATLERELGPSPRRRPLERDGDDLSLWLWVRVMRAGHLAGLRLVDFVTERDATWTADRYREQPEPSDAKHFRAPREDRLDSDELARTIDEHLSAQGWRLVVFDLTYGKPMPAEVASQVIAKAPLAGLAGRLKFGDEAFRRSVPAE